MKEATKTHATQVMESRLVSPADKKKVKDIPAILNRFLRKRIYKASLYADMSS